MENATINYFDSNIDGFLEAEKYIRRHCISFAGHDITAPCNARVFDTLARQFSHCDPATLIYNFSCVCMVNCKPIRCTAEVGIDASVRIRPALYFDEIKQE